MMALTSDQANELRERLRSVGRWADGYVGAIDMQAALCMNAGNHRRVRASMRARMETVVRQTTALRDTLKTEAPFLGGGFDWTALDAALSAVTKMADLRARQAETVAGTRGRGRPTELERDLLIAVIRRAYPSGKLPRGVGAHFEETVALVLGWIGRSVEDVHKTAQRAVLQFPVPAP